MIWRRLHMREPLFIALLSWLVAVAPPWHKDPSGCDKFQMEYRPLPRGADRADRVKLARAANRAVPPPAASTLA